MLMPALLPVLLVLLPALVSVLQLVVPALQPPCHQPRVLQAPCHQPPVLQPLCHQPPVLRPPCHQLPVGLMQSAAAEMLPPRCRRSRRSSSDPLHWSLPLQELSERCRLLLTMSQMGRGEGGTPPTLPHQAQQAQGAQQQ